MKHNYSVYMHVSPSGKKYIGITGINPKDRWNSGWGYAKSSIFGKAIIKYGWNSFEHIILFQNLTKKQAEDKEVELIRIHETYDRQFGYNQELGGNVGKVITKETRAKMSNAKKGKKPPNYGKHISEKQRQHLSVLNKGKTISKDVRDKISASTLGHKNKRSLKVSQYSFDDKLIKTWDCMMDAQRETGISNSKICAVCKGKRKTAGGFIWKYANEEENPC